MNRLSARPPSRIYRLQKLARRNKAAFAFGAIVVSVLICWVGTSTWLLQKEREARRRAVAAEQQQTSLRLEAEDRERIAQAAFLISQDKMEEADAFVGKVSVVKPSLETESVLRTLGQWHALKGRWAQAAARFNLLLDADQRDNSWAITYDLLMAGPILLERGDMEGYERFRRAAIARCAGTTDPNFAERTLKICLLTPADEQMMKMLRPFSDVTAKFMQGTNPGRYVESWRCVSLALMAYRQDNIPTAKVWCQKCLSFADGNLGRYATAHVIQAMSCYKLGETDEARLELAQGRDLISAQFAKGLEGNSLGQSKSLWYDWFFARILLHEAETLIEKSSPFGN